MPEALRDLSWPALAGVVLAFFLTLTVANVALGFALERAMPKRKIFAVPLAKGQLGHELVGNAVFLGVTAVTVTGALGSGVIRFGEESFARGAATFAVMLLGFQVFYYFLHRAMHVRALLRFHRWHHESQVTTPLSAQSVSFVEACGWMFGYVALPLALSLVAPLSFWGLAGYLAFNVSGNIVGHANVEPNAPAAASRGATLFANVFVYHALHHARWTGHYSFQAATMDRLFGTEYRDWPELYARVSQGKALTSLQERGDSYAPLKAPAGSGSR